MLDLFIEMTDQVFWEGYASQLQKEKPNVYQQRLNQFIDYQEQGEVYLNDTNSYFINILKKNYHGNLQNQLQPK